LPYWEVLAIVRSHVTKKAVIKDFGNKPITIVPISDIHLGNKGCNIEKFEQALNLINETPDCYTILMGDQTETATKTSVGLGMFEEDFDLTDQIKVLKEVLKPLADNGKILGMLTGNHEMRVSYMVKLNPAELICEKLNVPYLGYQGYILAKVGEQKYHIFASHGSSFGGSPAGKIMAARQLSKIADADIYLSGHTHAKLHDQEKLFRINEETGTVEPIVKHYIVCGSFLEYWGTYPEMKALAPSFTGVTAIRLEAANKYVQVTT
jgi:UDP-2,3-diacylglucosamine pyrophosphatase LpxH